MARSAIVFSTLLPLLAAGCFQYTPVGNGSVDAQERLRLSFASPEDVELVNGTTVRAVEHVEGMLVRQDGDTLLVRADDLHQVGGGRNNPPSQQLLWIPTTRLQEMEKRQLNTTRTALLAAGIAVTGALVGPSLFGGETGGTRPGPPEDEGGLYTRGIEFVLPFRIPLAR